MDTLARLRWAIIGVLVVAVASSLAALLLGRQAWAGAGQRVSHSHGEALRRLCAPDPLALINLSLVWRAAILDCGVRYAQGLGGRLY